MMEEMVSDYPKIHSPFVRENNEDGDYVVIDEVNEGYEWVFEEDDVLAVEKLDGTNVSILIENGEIIGVWNRKNRIKPFNSNTQHHRIIKGIQNAISRNYTGMLPDGQHFGELLGPKINGNNHELDGWLWYPFAKAKKSLRYKSWGNYPKTYDVISEWFEDSLFSLFASRHHDQNFEESSVSNGTFCEGIMFYRSNGDKAKLRRDMWSWYEGNRH